jgi:hypothetical protein
MQAAPTVAGFPAVPNAPLKPLGSSVRWATLALALVLAGISGNVTVRVGAWALALAGMTIWQSDDRAGKDRTGRLPAVLGLLVAVAAVVTTGTWSSPFVLCLLGGIMTIGFVGGFVAGVTSAIIASLAVALPYHLHLQAVSAESLRTTGEWTE